MIQFREKVVTVLFCLFLAGPVLLLCASALKAPLPVWLSTAEAQYLSGGVSHGSVRSSLSLDGLFGKRLQDAIDGEVGDNVPCKATALLTHARLERLAIRASNVLFGYGAYPTFFGSDRIADDAWGVVYHAPVTRTEYSPAFFDEVGRFCNALVRGNESANWFYYLPCGPNVSEANPAASLVSHSVAYSSAIGEIEARLDDACDVLAQPYSTQDEYVSQMFRTDHHFQIQGAIAEYRTICKAFGKEPIALPDPTVVYKGPFYGSSARAALMDDYSDVIYDVSYPPSNLKVWFDGAEVDMSAVDRQFSANASSYRQSSRYTNVYTDWFHGHRRLIEYENQDLDGRAGTLLIVADSYINSGDRLYAENWKHVYIVDPRKVEGGIDELREIIAACNPDDIAITLALSTYKQIGYIDIS